MSKARRRRKAQFKGKKRIGKIMLGLNLFLNKIVTNIEVNELLGFGGYVLINSLSC